MRSIHVVLGSHGDGVSLLILLHSFLVPLVVDKTMEERERVKPIEMSG